MEPGLPFCPDPGDNSLLLDTLKYKYTGQGTFKHSQLQHPPLSLHCQVSGPCLSITASSQSFLKAIDGPE